MRARVMSTQSREARRRSAKKTAGVAPAFYSSLTSASPKLLPDFRPGHAKNKGKRNADKRSSGSSSAPRRPMLPSAPRFGRGSPVGVPPRLSLRRPNATAQLQHRASRAGASQRALPVTGQPQFSEAPRGPVVVPVGRNSRSRPGAGGKSARGRRTRSDFRHTFRKASLMSRRSVCNRIGDECQ